MTTAEIVGRERELDAVERFLDGLGAGAAALLLAGEAGVGKTTIWQQGLAMGRARGLLTLVSRPGELETKLAYAAIGDLLEPVADDVLAVLPAARAQALRQALLIGDALGPSPDQRAVSLAVLEAIRALAREHAVLIAIDDLQWLDVSSAHVLHFALRRLEADPVAVITTVRGETDVEPSLFRRSLPPRGSSESRSDRSTSARSTCFCVRVSARPSSARRSSSYIARPAGIPSLHWSSLVRSPNGASHSRRATRCRCRAVSGS